LLLPLSSDKFNIDVAKSVYTQATLCMQIDWPLSQIHVIYLTSTYMLIDLSAVSKLAA